MELHLECIVYDPDIIRKSSPHEGSNFAILNYLGSKYSSILGYYAIPTAKYRHVEGMCCVRNVGKYSSVDTT